MAHTVLNLRTTGEERIALLFDHDAPMIASLLGTLKAGKIYVPLDPLYPAERLSYIFEDSQAGAILTNDRNLAAAQALVAGGVQIINTDHLDTTTPTNDLEIAVEPTSLAYLLYTSGSTGQPKGVMQNHRNVLHFIRAYTNNLRINDDDRLTLLSSYCFDAAVMDIYGALLNGATLYPVDIKADGLIALSEWLNTEKITIYHSTPTVYRYFLNSLNGGNAFPDVRLVVLGGEEVIRADAELYKKHFSDRCLFVNGLGPTEATVSLQYFVDKQTEIPRPGVPVGYPVEDTEILLLNAAGQPTEIYGEIAIRNEHVALGYWRNTEATAKAFGSCPTAGNRGTSPTPGSPSGCPAWGGAVREGSIRIYKTGDMGRRLPDGSIQFEGRKDSQVKIRGFRVELGEIESALTQHQLVREGVVVAKENAAGDKRLVAYVVLHERQESITTPSPFGGESGWGFSATQPLSPNPSPTERGEEGAELRNFLRQKLPDYLVPSSFVVLDSLPLTASGKLNRRALPAPDDSDRAILAAPKTPLEKSLTAIWADVLEVKAIGVNDNFFELGGHSLLAVRLFALIEKRFGRRLPLATLFQTPTVAQLAAVLQKEIGRAHV